MLDRVLVGLVSAGLIAAAVLAGKGSGRPRWSLRIGLVAFALLVVGLFWTAILWGTGETADQAGVDVAWMGPVTLVTFFAAGLAAVVAAVSGAAALAHRYRRG